MSAVEVVLLVVGGWCLLSLAVGALVGPWIHWGTTPEFDDQGRDRLPL